MYVCLCLFPTLVNFRLPSHSTSLPCYTRTACQVHRARLLSRVYLRFVCECGCLCACGLRHWCKCENSVCFSQCYYHGNMLSVLSPWYITSLTLLILEIYIWKYLYLKEKIIEVTKVSRKQRNQPGFLTITQDQMVYQRASLFPLFHPPPSLNGGTKEMGYKCLGKKKREKKKSERRNNKMEVDREARKERKEGECKKKE